MYTATDIRNVEFSKNMGGYKAVEVDAFVESCADTVEALTAEKDALNKKLAILADSLMEYRRDEDSIRSALLSAQRMGDSIVKEANEKAEQITAAANAEAAAIVENAKKDIASYENELERVKKEVSDFKASVLTLYKEHLALLKRVPEYQAPVQTEAPAPQEVAPVVVEPEQPEAAEEPAPSAPAQPRSKFANLKFGENYSLDNDDDE